MKHLVIYSHFNTESFSKAVVDKLVESAIAKGHEIKIIDLYAEKFDPVMTASDLSPELEASKEILVYQEIIKWADHYTLVYPMWWGQMPAILKGFIDRVFTNGVAYKFGPDGPTGLLSGRTARLIINTGTPDEFYANDGMHRAQIRVNDGGVFGFCGIHTKITFFGNVPLGSDELRQSYLGQIPDLIP